MQLVNRLKPYGIFIGFLFVSAIISIVSPQFLTLSNITIIFTQVAINALLAFGVTFVIITGGIDLSIGSVVALAGIFTALMAHPGEYPLIVPIFSGLLAGLIFGAINGFLVIKTKIAPFIITLGTMTIARGLALIISKGRPISNLSETFEFIGNGSVWGIPFPVIILMIVFIICTIVLQKTVLGRYIYAIGGNESAARVSGINIHKIKLTVYMISGLLAGLAGIILTARVTTGQPNTGAGFELDAIAAAVIGGTSTTGGVGTITGTLIGALLIGVINNGLDLMNVTSYYQQVIMGCIIIGAVVLDSWNAKK
jgi:ribose/xylose/arabinose/galactoside ABC-type transport system permease subunit